MAIDDFIKQYATIIIWGIHLVVAFYIFGEGKVLNYNLNKFIVILLLVASLFVFNKLLNALQVSQTNEFELQKQVDKINNNEQPIHQPKPEDISMEDVPWK